MKSFRVWMFVVTMLGCGGGGLVVRGVVEDQKSQPLEGARVSMSCPDALQESGLRLLATTDSNGQTTRKAPPPKQPLQDRCQIFVTADGYEHETYPIDAVCGRWAGTTCVEVALRATLKPEAESTGIRGAITLTIEMIRDGEVISSKDLPAPQGSPASITLRNNGIPYELNVTPTWIDRQTVSLEGTWATGTGGQGVVDSEPRVGEAVTIDMGDGISMTVRVKGR